MIQILTPTYTEIQLRTAEEDLLHRAWNLLDTVRAEQNEPRRSFQEQISLWRNLNQSFSVFARFAELDGAVEAAR
jgi:hypothetical protein